MFYALTGPELKASHNLRLDVGDIELSNDEARVYAALFPPVFRVPGHLLGFL